MSTVAYQCPCCGAPLEYGAQSGKLECRACSNSYELDAIEAMHASEETGGIQFDMPTESFGAQEAAQMQAYICQGCGAELMTEETTTATQCPYCGSPTILPERIEGGVKPELVIPFTVSKEAAQQEFETYFKGKKLLPNVFLNSRNRIAEMRRLYVPYWLFDCSASGSATYDAQKRRVRREGDWEITETEHYLVSRSGAMDFSAIPVDGSEKLDNKITESLEPYDMSAAVAFAPAVLAGALADHADVKSADCEARARERVQSSMEQALRSTVTGYSTVNTRRQSFHAEGGKVTPVLMPVWLITTVKEGTTYTFAINGQTGKLTCDVPADGKKSFLWGGGVFAGVFALLCALMAAAGMLAGGTLLIAAIIALIAGVITVSVLTGQLKQAAHAGGAGDYIVKDSFRLSGRKDYYLHTTRTRRKIEKKPDSQPGK
ncbi:MAG: hypothetical protein IKJ11_06380 [Clostridia bacterium]|nr:hypothetical protein [Clostridia bacterium]